MTRLLFIVMLLLIGQGFFIISKEKIDVHSEIGKDKLVTLYLAWFGGTYDKFFEVTGKVVKTDWFSYNFSNLTHS
jgi:hypothetical protein